MTLRLPRVGNSRPCPAEHTFPPMAWIGILYGRRLPSLGGIHTVNTTTMTTI